MTPAEVKRLDAATADILGLAKRFGLDPYPTHFELVPATIMYEFGAYGIPGRFSHWTHGRAYQQIKTMYDYGLSKIYELVINTNPAYAFLLENNTLLQNTLVVAHVLAHVDFFKNNAYFEKTNRGMLETVSLHAERMRRYEFEYGRPAVESILDAVLSIQEHVDPASLGRTDSESSTLDGPSMGARHSARGVGDQRVLPYDDLFYVGVNKRPEPTVRERRFPAEPEKDLVLFIAQHAIGLEDWQRDVIQMIRAEQQYFIPQMQTKIMNEGWASFWHSRILRELDLSEHEYVEFARLHSSVLAPSGRNVNPYYIGLKLFEDIERRWDAHPDGTASSSGREHGGGAAIRREDGAAASGGGRAKVFDVRELDCDASFLRNYLTRDLVEELDLYIYRREGDAWVIAEKDWEVVRDSILKSMTNFGQPYIVVEDGDYRGNRELYLKHRFEGQDLDLGYADRTLRFVQRLWGRPVHLETTIEEKTTVIGYAGQSGPSEITRH